MRSIKLTWALAAAAALLVLASAGTAAAHVRVHPPKSRTRSGSCRVQLQVAPRLLTSGETSLAYGRELCGGAAPTAGQPVTLYDRTVGSAFTAVGTGVTDPMGYFQVTTPALTENSYFYATAGTSSSITKLVKVAALVSLEGPSENGKAADAIRTGRRNAVTFTGSVSPEDAGALVLLQRENAVKGNEWHWIGRTVVNSTGGFSITHIFRAAGESDIRVVIRSGLRNVASPSNVLSYSISQAQNPSLTILSSADPISYGGSVEISGVAAGLANTTLTLMAHVAHEHPTAVTTTTTNGEGKYVFPAQSPLASTFYTVQGGGRSSSVLYQGVKYVLSAAPLSETVTSGTPVTFSGSVSPAIAGHSIYLERQDPDAAKGFHAVEVGTVAANGTYTISHTFYAAGVDVLRVKIPGDPEHGGTASQQYNITITPAPSASLTIEPGGNGKLPPVGTV